jgi:hypothetical protein
MGTNVLVEPAAPIFSHLLFYPENGGSRFIRNVEVCPPKYMASCTRRMILTHCKNLKLHLTIHSNGSVLLLVKNLFYITEVL